MYYTYKPLRNDLRVYELIEALATAHRFIQLLDFNRPLPAGLLPNQILYQAIDPMKLGLFQWEFEILIREIVLNCRLGSGKRLDSWQDVAKKINAIKKIENDIWSRESCDGDILYELVRMAHRQFPWQRGFTQDFMARYHWLYRQEGIEDLIVAEYGLNATQLFQIALSLCGHFMSSMAAQLPLKNEINSASLSGFAKILSRLTINLPELRESYKSFSDYNINWAYTFNPLRSTPLIRVEDKLICPIPSFLIRRVTSEIYFDLVKHDKKFSQFYGPAVQRLVGKIFEVQGGGGAYEVLPEAEFGSKSKRQDSIDWIISDETAHLFVECKAARVRYKGISDLTDKSNIVSEFLRIKNFAIQAYKTLACALDGQYNHWKPDGKPVYIMLVTLEDWQSFGILVQDHIINPLRNDLEELGLDPDMTRKYPMSFCPVDDLEFAARVFCDVGISQVLHRKSEGEYPQWAMGTYLGQNFSDSSTNFEFKACADEWDFILRDAKGVVNGWR